MGAESVAIVATTGNGCIPFLFEVKANGDYNNP